MKEILFLLPVFKETVWGGNLLKTEFGYEIPSEHTGECWAVSAHPNGDCKIAEGTFSQETLSSLWENHHELFGNASGESFPLLTKIIDAKEDLSIQVHPDDTYAMANENGSSGKAEFWYILDCEADATIILGHYANTKEELKQMVEEHRWKELIREIPIQKGDFLQINAGTIHAIKGGTLLLETQQNSDITYRLYDYDRLSEGVLRELHTEKSIDVIVCPTIEEKMNIQNISLNRQLLIQCKYYCVEKIKVDGFASFTQDKNFQILSIIEGKGDVDGHPIKKGDHFILPYEYGSYTIEGNLELILSYQP